MIVLAQILPQVGLGSIVSNMIYTIQFSIAGFVLALITAIFLMFLIYVSGRKEIIATIATILNTVPALFWVYTLLILFGIFSPIPPLLVVMISVLAIMLPFISESLTLVEDRYLELSKLVNAPQFRSFILLVLPASIPILLKYVRAGIGTAVRFQLVFEALAGSYGMGAQMALAYSVANIELFVFWVLLAVSIVFIIDLILMKTTKARLI